MLAWSGCSDTSGPVPIVEKRELSGGEQQIRIVESSAERHRMSEAMMRAAGGGAADAPAQAAGPSGIRFQATTPEGWTPRAGSMMRELNYTLGENGEGECYLSLLPGAAGGLLANVNRWRGQMSQPPIDEAAAAALPKTTLFGREAVFIDIEGAFQGMGAADAKSDYRMLGVILTADVGTVFVKLTGPKALVAANEENFKTFYTSLRPAE